MPRVTGSINGVLRHVYASSERFPGRGAFPGWTSTGRLGHTSFLVLLDECPDQEENRKEEVGNRTHPVSPESAWRRFGSTLDCGTRSDGHLLLSAAAILFGSSVLIN